MLNRIINDMELDLKGSYDCNNEELAQYHMAIMANAQLAVAKLFRDSKSLDIKLSMEYAEKGNSNTVALVATTPEGKQYRKSQVIQMDKDELQMLTLFRMYVEKICKQNGIEFEEELIQVEGIEEAIKSPTTKTTSKSKSKKSTSNSYSKSNLYTTYNKAQIVQMVIEKGLYKDMSKSKINKLSKMSLCEELSKVMK